MCYISTCARAGGLVAGLAHQQHADGLELRDGSDPGQGKK